MYIRMYFSLFQKMVKYCWIYYVTSTSSSSPFQPKPNPIIPESFLEDFLSCGKLFLCHQQTRAKSKQTEHINFMTISLTNIYLCRVLLGSIKHGVKTQNSLFHFSRRKKLGVMWFSLEKYNGKVKEGRKTKTSNRVTFWLCPWKWLEI